MLALQPLFPNLVIFLLNLDLVIEGDFLSLQLQTKHLLLQEVNFFFFAIEFFEGVFPVSGAWVMN